MRSRRSELLRRGARDPCRPQGRDRGTAARREEGCWSIMQSPMRAKPWAASSPNPPRRRSFSPASPRVFGLAEPPRRIEVYDNSHIQGAEAVGAMIVAGPEGFIKSQYRKFNIRSEDLDAGDDFGMMREVLTRRFRAAAQGAWRAEPANETDPDQPQAWPDLVLIDGGAGPAQRGAGRARRSRHWRSVHRRRRKGTRPRCRAANISMCRTSRPS